MATSQNSSVWPPIVAGRASTGRRRGLLLQAPSSSPGTPALATGAMEQTLPVSTASADDVLADGLGSVPIGRGTGSRRYSALLHHYYLHEICPIRFGPQQDITSTLLTILLTILLLHGALWLWSQTSRGRGIWQEYAESSQFLVGVIVYLWVTGYNVVSWVIWYQFERAETYPADDYYMAPMGDDTGAGHDLSPPPTSGGHRLARSRTQPILVQLPNDQLAVGLKS